MRRWLALLLLALLPLQFTWAAVAGYCAHESGPGVAHFGHHTHHGHAHAADAGDASEAAPAGEAADADCGHCHGGVAAVAGAAADRAGPGPGDAPRAAGEARRHGHLPSAPERPQWARPA